jgi:hypothetical protein
MALLIITVVWDVTSCSLVDVNVAGEPPRGCSVK